MARNRSGKPDSTIEVYRPRLVRSPRGRVIAGVCSALAARFGVSPTVVRLAFVASLFLPGPQILLYLALWVLIPASHE